MAADCSENNHDWHTELSQTLANNGEHTIGQHVHFLYSRNHHHCFQWIDYEFIITKRNPVLSLTSSKFKRALQVALQLFSNPKLKYHVPKTTHFAQFMISVLNFIILNQHVVSTLILASQFTIVQSAGGDDDLPIKSTIQPFDGVVSAFTPWLIAFTALIAWKKPELSSIMNGTSTRPEPADENNPTALESKRIKAWDLLNIRLYGALVSYVAPTIQASLHVDSMHDGVAALRYLKQRYGSQSTGDRAEATARLQRSHIDARAKISADDVTRQYNEMSLAATDIVASNGPRPGDSLMISMFENALPSSYGPIRQMMRYAQHTTFDGYYNDLLAQVKAEIRSSESHSVGAFTTSQAKGKGAGGSKGKGKAKGNGYKGRWQGGRGGGGGRGAHSNMPATYQTSYQNPCFNCLSMEHTRDVCPNAPTKCVHCGWNHMSELCPVGPGGALRDNLSPAAWDILERQSQRPYRANNSGKRPYDRSAYSSHTTQSSSQSGPSSTDDTLQLQLQAYLLGKRSAARSSASDIAPSDSVSAIGSSSGGAHVAKRANTASSRVDLDEIDEFISQFRPSAHMVYSNEKHLSPSAQLQSRGTIVYIDSQATNFVVPSIEYLEKITDSSPTTRVDTANGSVKPSAIGTLRFSIFDDDGSWHNFTVEDVWVIESCERVLYSQRQMSELGVVHRLDEGTLILPNGAQKAVSKDTYTIEVVITDSNDAHLLILSLHSHCCALKRACMDEGQIHHRTCRSSPCGRG